AKARNARMMPTAAGSPIFSRRISRSWLPPGAAQPRRATRSRSASSDIAGSIHRIGRSFDNSDVRENVLIGPAGKIEQGAIRQEIEAGHGKRRAALALEALVQL